MKLVNVNVDMVLKVPDDTDTPNITLDLEIGSKIKINDSAPKVGILRAYTTIICDEDEPEALVKDAKRHGK